MDLPLSALKLEPQIRDYVWGGNRLRPGQRTAEAWIVHESNTVQSGPFSGKALGQLAGQYGKELLGKTAYDRTGYRFPVLIKLLDCADWLSLQVHPNNEQAQALEGEGQFGKTEAWHILHAEPGSDILCGFQPGVSPDAIRQSVRDGSILNFMQRLKMNTGDTVFIPAGTVHALGPGLLVYEVQQTSDITYRVFDWNRPASAGRKLHIDQSLAVLDPDADTRPIPEPVLANGEGVTLVQCPYFKLDLLQAGPQPVRLNTAGISFHSITVVAGDLAVSGPGWEFQLNSFDTLLVPANQGEYSLFSTRAARILKSSVE